MRDDLTLEVECIVVYVVRWDCFPSVRLRETTRVFLINVRLYIVVSHTTKPLLLVVFRSQSEETEYIPLSMFVVAVFVCCCCSSSFSGGGGGRWHWNVVMNVLIYMCTCKHYLK